MAKSRKIEDKALGKHVGHACEGHLRGILSRWATANNLSVQRALPFDFHVNPDLVITDQTNLVKLIVVVAFWNNSDNSHMKFYRTRSEYTEAKMAMTQMPSRFTSDAKVITVIYGAPGGWKEKIIKDLETSCSPCLYLPEALDAQKSQDLSQEAFNIYAEHWQSGKSGAREYTEAFFAGQTKLSVASKALLKILTDEIAKEVAPQEERASKSTKATSVRLPTQPIRTRYRQALGMLSLFKDEEIIGWKNHKATVALTGAVKEFVLRAAFLDLIQIQQVKSLVGMRMNARLRRPVKTIGGTEHYAPDLADFESWAEIPQPELIQTLSAHRERTRSPGSVFKGGAFDQVAGNWRGMAQLVREHVPKLVAALKAGDKALAVRLLMQGPAMRPEEWHPAHQSAQTYPLWSLAVCSLAIARQDRATRSDFDARRQQLPSVADARELVKAMSGLPQVADLLGDAIPFMAALESADLATLGAASRPRLLALTEPCSWLADLYNTLTTNSSHNPIAGPVFDWLALNYPGYVWSGWPQRRSVSLSEALGSAVGRRQWQFIGKGPDKDAPIVAAEVKSITANNWGNKSKELYDRVAESRDAAAHMGLKIQCIGVLDGDFGQEHFDELASGIGYDQVYSINEVLKS
ncbi:MAG: hypothetical protein WAK59_09775 [Aquabacterium sp.]